MCDVNHWENWMILNHVRHKLCIQSDVLLVLSEIVLMCAVLLVLSEIVLTCAVVSQPVRSSLGSALWRNASGRHCSGCLHEHRSCCMDPLHKKFKNVDFVMDLFDNHWYGGCLSRYGSGTCISQLEMNREGVTSTPVPSTLIPTHTTLQKQGDIYGMS